MGCSIGCKECDGGAKGPGNPNRIDRCGAGMKATNNDPATRTINRGAVAGSADDWTKFNPWRAPGHAPIYDPCGRASGGPHATSGKGEFTNTTYAKLGDLGSRVLPKYDTGTVWEAGSTVETMTSFRAVHGGSQALRRPRTHAPQALREHRAWTGGYQFRLCPLESNLTEACVRATAGLTRDCGRDSDGRQRCSRTVPADADAVRAQLEADGF